MTKPKTAWFAILLLVSFLATSISVDAKGGSSSGGSRSGGSVRSSSPSVKSTPSTSAKTSGSVSSSSTSSKPSTASTTPKVSTKPTASTKTADAPVKTTSSGKKTLGKANVVDESYRPTFRGGYTPPLGSQVQYVNRGASFIDYLPWIFLFSQSSRDRINTQEAVVKEPDQTVTNPDGTTTTIPGEEKTVVEDDGSTVLVVFNWIIMIALAGGLVYGVMYIVNSFTNNKSNKKAYV